MEVFKEKVAVEVPTSPEVSSTSTVRTEKDDTAINETKDPEMLEIWEAEKGKKFVNEYFGSHIIGNTFQVKMPMGEINKFILERMETDGMEKTTKNYREMLSQIEQEIGSEKLTFFKRMEKLTGYIRAMQKLYRARALRDKYVLAHQSE